MGTPWQGEADRLKSIAKRTQKNKHTGAAGGWYFEEDMRNGVSRVVWREQPNGLPISRAVPINRDAIVAENAYQNRRDLVDA
jgi:hypothetical protein